MSDLHDAVSTNNTARLAELIAAGANLEVVNEYGQTALCFAIWLDRVDMVKALLAAGANPSTPMVRFCGTLDNSSPLITAAEGGNDAVAQLLLAAGADINYRRSICNNQANDFSALDVAVCHNRWSIARMLVPAGADMTAPSILGGQNYNVSPLVVVASRGQTNLVRRMLEHGADVHYVSTKYHGIDIHWTPLLLAVKRWTVVPASVSALVNADADPFELDLESRTPTEFAMSKGDMKSETMLLDSHPTVV